MAKARLTLPLLAAAVLIVASSLLAQQPEPHTRKPASAHSQTAAEAAAVIPMSSAGMTDGKVIFEKICSSCHGIDGGGKVELKSPAIAALPESYARYQILGFREGRRGHIPEDTPSYLMAMIAKQLTDVQVNAVVAHITSLPRVVPTSLEKDWQNVDLANGQMLFQERCMECHRYNASGEIAFGSPPLVGQQAWYLMAQITKFKKGQRGTVKGDVNGAKMVLLSNFIEDEQMLRDIVAYILSLNPRPERPATSRDGPFEAVSR